MVFTVQPYGLYSPQDIVHASNHATENDKTIKNNYNDRIKSKENVLFFSKKNTISEYLK